MLFYQVDGITSTNYLTQTQMHVITSPTALVSVFSVCMVNPTEEAAHAKLLYCFSNTDYFNSEYWVEDDELTFPLITPVSPFSSAVSLPQWANKYNYIQGCTAVTIKPLEDGTQFRIVVGEIQRT